MQRADIIATVGREYLTSNYENSEFSYPQAFKTASLPYTPIRSTKAGTTYTSIDLRFVIDRTTILVETKADFLRDIATAQEQLSAYVEYEKQLTGNNVVAILANTLNDDLRVWRGVVSDADFMAKETLLRSAQEYADFYAPKVNNKEQVMRSTYALNELLHRHGISERLRSQFVGTCLLALKNGLDLSHHSLTARQVRTRIKEVLEELLTNDLNKAEKLTLLNKNVLDSQDVRTLKIEDLREVLSFIRENILPFINDKTTSGQDLLNLFFITFNKYVGKADKNQAFTPDHITDFMTRVTGVNRHSVILDPCCGSGSFLVRAMTQALDDARNAQEQERIRENQIYGVEYDENIYGLATTNMLIHSDGNSNIIQGSCFDRADWIEEAHPTVVLMNPPYNAQRKHLTEKYTKTWDSKRKEDPSKGFYFVSYIADLLNQNNISATLAVLLPVACAIGTSGEVARFKERMLESNTLDAVFSFPNEIFYPGAAVSVCCMVFKIGKKHEDVSNPDTFFGYFKDDGFQKRKNLGRVEQRDTSTGGSLWTEIQERWLDVYRNRQSVPGLSAVQKVGPRDEWLAEAYMTTDYSTLSEADFQQTLNDYFAYIVKSGKGYES